VDRRGNCREPSEDSELGAVAGETGEIAFCGEVQNKEPLETARAGCLAFWRWDPPV